jgi:quercetin dioxygenase-like cupin family protein
MAGLMETVKFPEPESVGPRQWGREVLLAHAPEKWTLKRIEMTAGAEGGLQYHRLKDEGGVMVEGVMKVIYDDGSGDLVERIIGAGTAFHFPTGSVHKAVAITDGAYIELSTPHFNDRVHVESQYGLESEAGGLPSTELGEVELR